MLPFLSAADSDKTDPGSSVINIATLPQMIGMTVLLPHFMSSTQDIATIPQIIGITVLLCIYSATSTLYV